MYKDTDRHRRHRRPRRRHPPPPQSQIRPPGPRLHTYRTC